MRRACCACGVGLCWRVRIRSLANGFWMILKEDKESWEEAARIIRAGGVVVFPTDTVYGIGCDPYSEEAIARVFAVKERSHLKALPLLLAEVSVVGRVTQGQNETAVALGEAFWPGALTLVVRKAGGLPEALGGVRLWPCGCRTTMDCVT